MEIIKKGKLPSERVFVAVCDHCSTKFRFKQSEGKVTYDQRDGDFISVKCPLCKKTVHKDFKS